MQQKRGQRTGFGARGSAEADKSESDKQKAELSPAEREMDWMDESSANDSRLAMAAQSGEEPIRKG